MTELFLTSLCIWKKMWHKVNVFIIFKSLKSVVSNKNVFCFCLTPGLACYTLPPKRDWSETFKNELIMTSDKPKRKNNWFIQESHPLICSQPTALWWLDKADKQLRTKCHRFLEDQINLCVFSLSTLKKIEPTNISSVKN